MIDTIDITKAEAIYGWMNSYELKWLAEQAANHRTIIEIGSYYGRSTRALGDNTPGHVVAIDTWVGPISMNTRQIMPSFEQNFRNNLSDLIVSKKVIPTTPDSEILHGLVPDMVFIDGDHEYDSVVKDIQTWKSKIREGGLLCGHDFSCPDVTKAVTELLDNIIAIPMTDLWCVDV